MSLLVSTDTSLEPLMPPYPVQRFTVEQYLEIAAAEVLGDERVELLEGWIVPKMVRNSLHDGTVDLIEQLLHKLLADGWYARSQKALVSEDSVPEPDVAIVRGTPRDYFSKHPQGSDVAVAIEVAVSSINRDRRKASIYARAGVAAYWIVNLQDRCVEVFDSLLSNDGKAQYSRQRVLKDEERLEITLDGRECSLTCNQVLPEPVSGS
ncbi:hypothetical protein ETAA8_42810 [Anatilimnocola aggregata]|uniref:Putative restriction endonuclease domain-containing protein n=2 Tax=Anatilimnocola aggregata TaxID=2528021 RepID=A0A517YG24_9BACT|nr:hypothetical protein ETAA8_42810 [Anatilimnocola aggregata]